MRILVTNDDGLQAPGLRALARAASAFGEVRVLAPSAERSAASHSVSIHRPLLAVPVPLEGFEAYGLDGTPADCVLLGVHLWPDTELVLSGVNAGSNLGHEIWHSGTVGAARQATLLGLPGVAFSAVRLGGQWPGSGDLELWAERVLRALLPAGPGTLHNVNIPPQPTALTWTDRVSDHYFLRLEVTPGAQRPAHRFQMVADPQPPVGTDTHAVLQRQVSIARLSNRLC